jgi:hypothetical protein
MPQLPDNTPFKKAGKIKSAKPDRRGYVAVRVILMRDPPNGEGTDTAVQSNSSQFFPMPGNRREDIVLQDTTVGEVYEHLNKVLFGGEEG